VPNGEKLKRATMTHEDSLTTPQVAPSRSSGNVKLVFHGAEGLRAGWKVLLFAAVVVTLFLATRPLIDLVAPRSPTGSISLQTDLLREFWLVLLALAATWVMARLERRPLRSYGYLYGAPQSGTVDPWRLIATHPTGDPLWSGGSAGPEGSLLLLPLLVALAVGMAFWWRRGNAWR
jgi:hypothetical protein